VITRFIRKLLSDNRDDYTFHKFENRPISFERGTGLYIHIPFCKNMCPYCPYSKVPYNKALVNEFKNALVKEIQLYAQQLGKTLFSSLYIGGGTPTLTIDALADILEELRKHFIMDGQVGIEANPEDINEQVAGEIRSLGCNLVSLGVQSFQRKLLIEIGRNYTSETALRAVEVLRKQGFDVLNIDLIFALKNQTTDELRNDLQIASDLAVDQITCYPLFTFPYTAIGKFRKAGRVRLPNHFVRRKMYYFINSFMEKEGYHRTSVWSFNKNKTKRYSSVTRDYYLGLGPSAASYNGKTFRFNTFSVQEYIKSLNNGRLPIALRMGVSKRMEKLFWLYWRLYETSVPKKEYIAHFGNYINDDFGWMLRIIRVLNFVEYEDHGVLVLNKNGAHWVHLVQNYYALDYVNRIWSVAQEEAWPDKVKL
jgi:oxygen-independent coproporphyrinogen-3 oxidase